jgi:hypothetical protein
LVVMLQLCIELVCFLLEGQYFVLLGRDVSFKLFDFVVEHKLKLFKFLSLLLQTVNLFFSLCNLLVLLVDHLELFGNLSLEFVTLCVLGLVLLIFVLNLSIELLNVRLDVLKLVVGQLKFSLRLQT